MSSTLTMWNAIARCVGIASVLCRETGLITGLIGVHGSVSGFITVNMSERTAIKVVEGLLQESFGELTTEVVDSAGEITNITVGGIKSSLAGSPWAFFQITIPSVVVGKGYHIAYVKGLEFVCATFEYEDDGALMLEDRLMRVSVSLLRL